jgi:hypothetical protein
MNTQIFSVFCPWAGSTSASIGIERVVSDTICGSYSQLGFILGSPAVMSGLVMVVDALVPMVMRHGLLSVQPGSHIECETKGSGWWC